MVQNSWSNITKMLFVIFTTIFSLCTRIARGRKSLSQLFADCFLRHARAQESAVFTTKDESNRTSQFLVFSESNGICITYSFKALFLNFINLRIASVIQVYVTKRLNLSGANRSNIAEGGRVKLFTILCSVVPHKRDKSQRL